VTFKSEHHTAPDSNTQAFGNMRRQYSWRETLHWAPDQHVGSSWASCVDAGSETQENEVLWPQKRPAIIVSCLRLHSQPGFTMQSWALLVASALIFSTSCSSAYEVVGQITGNQQLSPDFSKTRVVLNDGLYSTFVTSTGHFKFDDVPVGPYASSLPFAIVSSTHFVHTASLRYFVLQESTTWMSMNRS